MPTQSDHTGDMMTSTPNEITVDDLVATYTPTQPLRFDDRAPTWEALTSTFLANPVDAWAIEQLRAELRQHGRFAEPVYVSNEYPVVRSGQHTVIAAMLEGTHSITVIDGWAHLDEPEYVITFTITPNDDTTVIDDDAVELVTNWSRWLHAGDMWLEADHTWFDEDKSLFGANYGIPRSLVSEVAVALTQTIADHTPFTATLDRILEFDPSDEHREGWLSVAPTGWQSLVRELDAQLRERWPNYSIRQLKEKYGTLRFYANSGLTPPRTSDDDAGKAEHNRWYEENETPFQELVREYEDRSAEICVLCGKPGKLGTTGKRWYSTLCPDCAPNDWTA